MSADNTIDKKIEVLYDNYHDSFYAANASKEVEAIRRKATNTGMGITVTAFVANELARLSMRSRKYTRPNF